jgi:D-sedoheptulose 7-phosphate isomerase
MLQRIQQQFADSADLIYQAAQDIALPLNEAVYMVQACLTGGSKVLAYGQGLCADLARSFVHACVGTAGRTRPGLAALCLSTDSSEMAGESFSTLLAKRQLEALGQAGDVLLILALSVPDAGVAELVYLAHERDIGVVLLCPDHGGVLRAMALEMDVLIPLPVVAGAMRNMELQLVALHCVSEGVDALLLGERENME